MLKGGYLVSNKIKKGDYMNNIEIFLIKNNMISFISHFNGDLSILGFADGNTELLKRKMMHVKRKKRLIILNYDFDIEALLSAIKELDLDELFYNFDWDKERVIQQTINKLDRKIEIYDIGSNLRKLVQDEKLLRLDNNTEYVESVLKNGREEKVIKHKPIIAPNIEFFWPNNNVKDKMGSGIDNNSSTLLKFSTCCFGSFLWMGDFTSDSIEYLKSAASFGPVDVLIDYGKNLIPEEYLFYLNPKQIITICDKGYENILVKDKIECLNLKNRKYIRIKFTPKAEKDVKLDFYDEKGIIK